MAARPHIPFFAVASDAIYQKSKEALVRVGGAIGVADGEVAGKGRRHHILGIDDSARLQAEDRAEHGFSGAAFEVRLPPQTLRLTIGVRSITTR